MIKNHPRRALSTLQIFKLKKRKSEKDFKKKKKKN